MSEPIVRVLSLIVGSSCVVVVLVGARLLAQRRQPVATAEVATEAAAPRPARRSRPPTFHAAAVAAARAAPANGLVHLRGRVIGPPAMAADELAKNLEVEADDGEHRFAAETSGAGFELHLPPRSYTIRATASSLVGTAEVNATSGDTSLLTIILREPATIEGTLRLPEEARERSVQVRVFRPGSALQVSAFQNAGPGFFAYGLEPGRSYDLEIQVDGFRTARLRSITAPASNLEAALSAPAILRGAIGFPAGETCPLTSIELDTDTDSDDGEVRSVPVDPNCNFQFDHLPAVPEVVLRGSEHGWHLETRVAIPGEGDPAPVCLNPPCRDLPPVERARVEVILTGLPEDGQFTASLRGLDGGEPCQASGGDPCEIRDVTARGPMELSVTSNACGELSQTVELRPGLNKFTLACRRMRTIQGIVRSARGGATPGSIACRGGHHTRVEGFLFTIRCPSDQEELFFQGDDSSRPRRTAIAPHVDPLLVELTM